MGMLDYFEPEPELHCPRCGLVLSGWQGHDGDNALFVWRQGSRHPIDQCIDEDYRLSAEELTRFTLPSKFTIETLCTCSTRFLIEATGTSTNGLWSESKLVEPDEIENLYAHLPRSQRKAMRKWLLERV